MLDFGLAKVTSEGQADSALTGEGQMLGTPDYIAPEQIRNAQSADIRADIYSLGCTLYYLLAGRPPFRRRQPLGPLPSSLLDGRRAAKPRAPEVPVELAALVAKMLAKEPDRRFQTPSEVAQALTPFFKPASSPRPGPVADPPRTNPPVNPTPTTNVDLGMKQPAIEDAALRPETGGLRCPSRKGSHGKV